MKVKRFCILAFVVIIVALLVTPGFAEYTLQWVDGEYTYNGTLTYAGNLTRTQVTNFKVNHQYGTAELLRPTSGTQIYQRAIGPQRAAYEKLLNEAYFTNSARKYIDQDFNITIPSYAASGEYYLTVIFPGSSVTTQVTTLITDGNGNTTLHNRETLTSESTPKTSGAYVGYGVQ